MPVDALILAGALCAGIVTGLSGFGTGLTALGFWLYVLDPLDASALVVICSVIGQVQSLYTVRRAVVWGRVWPFLAGGLIGIPLGVAILRFIDARLFKLLLGSFLVGYTSLMLLSRRMPTLAGWGGRLADGVIGAGGGTLGGIAGLCGPLPTIWCSLRGWSADTQRAVCQPYNLVVLCIVLGVYASQGLLTGAVWKLALFCLPATALGTFVGMRLYAYVDDRQFRVLVLCLLLASGLVLSLSSFR